MRLLSSSAIHVLGLLRKAQEDPTAISLRDVSSFVWGAARNANNPRKLWDYGGFYGGDFGDEEEGDSFFDWGDDDDVPADGFGTADMFPPELAECGVDVTKIMGGFLDGAIPEDFDPDEMPPDILKIFAEEGEEDCTAEQEAQFMDAFASFTSCTGWDKLIEDQDALEDLVDKLQEECGAFVPSSPFDVAQVDFDFDDINDMDGCVDAVLGDNPLGEFLRDLYHNPGKNCACVAKFGDAVPACLIHPDDDEPQFLVPGSLIKKAACLVGKACDTVEDVCRDELQGLNQCLPPLDGMKSCYKVELDCAMEGTVSLVLPPKLTKGELPDTCRKVDEEEMVGKNIPDRLAAAYHKCLTDDEEAAPEEEAESALEDEVEEEAESALDITETSEYKLRGISTEPNEDEEVEKSSQALLGIVLAAVAGLAAATVIIARKVRDSALDDSDPAKNDFTKMPPIQAEGLEDNLVLPANTPHHTHQHQSASQVGESK